MVLAMAEGWLWFDVVAEGANDGGGRVLHGGKGCVHVCLRPIKGGEGDRGLELARVWWWHGDVTEGCEW